MNKLTQNKYLLLSKGIYIQLKNRPFHLSSFVTPIKPKKCLLKTAPPKSSSQVQQSQSQSQSDRMEQQQPQNLSEDSGVEEQDEYNQNVNEQQIHPRSEVGSAWKQQLRQYKTEICQYMAEKESKIIVRPNYYLQANIKANLKREQLIRYLFKAQFKLKLSRITLHLSVQYLDIFLSRQPQLKYSNFDTTVAQACLYIAMKYQQINYPTLRFWVKQSKQEEVLQRQADVLKALNYQLTHYTIEHHLDTILAEMDASQIDKNVKLIADLSLFDLQVRKYPPSKTAKTIVDSCIYDDCEKQGLSSLQKQTSKINDQNQGQQPFELCSNTPIHHIIDSLIRPRKRKFLSPKIMIEIILKNSLYRFMFD